MTAALVRPSVALLSFSLAATLGAAPVRTESGLVEGVASGGVVAWKGVPYAAPPTGELRWRAPRPAPAWPGVRKAGVYAHDCMQEPFPSDAAPLGTPPAEDCLYLNVWAPEKGAAKLPVMVWIHGGGFVNGGSSPAVYDGSQFAKRGIVFVSFNYRLGRFGFFAHPALTRESPQGPLGNYGYLDQIAALQWVQKNIAAFGGDPGNVTLFGESAGGGSVNALMISPLAKGLFHKAIVQSGGGRAGGPTAPRRMREPGPGGASGEAVGAAFAKLVGVTGEDDAALAALRKLPAPDLVRGMNLMSMGQQRDTYAGPMIDGQVVPEDVDAAFRAGTQARIPYVIGANDREFGFLPLPPAAVDGMLARFGAEKDRVVAAYDPAKTGEMSEVGIGLASDGAMVEPARHLARLASAHQPTYAYRFSYVASSLRPQTKGALHATEIPFVFATVRAKYGDATTAEDEAMGAAANAYWAAFARTGDPNGDGRPSWPVYRASSDMLLDFAPTGPAAKADPWKARLDIVERFAAGPPPAQAAAQPPQRVPTPNDTLVSTEVAPDGKLTFRIYAPKASEVGLRGDWMEGPGTEPLVKDDRGVWSATVGPLAPDFYSYSFVVDGVRTVDPKNALIKQGVTSVDNMVMVKGPEASFLEAKAVPHGEIRIAWYPSTTLGGERRLHVYTPPGYDSGKQTYPVFYLLHGGGDEDSGWSSIGRAGFILDNLLAEKKAPPMLIVMPNGSLPRPANLPPTVPGTTPSPEVAAALAAAQARFTSELLTDVVPFVEKTYRARKEPASRAIAGLSMGGGQTQRILVARPDAFRYVAIWSAGVRSDAMPGFEKDAAAFLAAPEKVNASVRLLSIRVGEKDFALPGSRNLSELFSKHKIEHKLEVNGGGHTWINWRLYLSELLPLLFR